MKIKKYLKYIFWLILIFSLLIVYILSFSSFEEKKFDPRGEWIFKRSINVPIKYLNNLKSYNITFNGIVKIGEVTSTGKNIFSIIKKNFYYVNKNRIEIFCKRNEIETFIFTGDFKNNNLMGGIWYYIGPFFFESTGYWEATRVSKEKDQTVNY